MAADSERLQVFCAVSLLIERVPLLVTLLVAKTENLFFGEQSFETAVVPIGIEWQPLRVVNPSLRHVVFERHDQLALQHADADVLRQTSRPRLWPYSL